MKPVIEVKNLSKKYKVFPKKKHVLLREELERFIRKPFSFFSQGQGEDQYFWALRDINFSVKQGQTVGIIGSNGSGKSTLLKIFSGITPPTKGKIVLRGKVTSLLETGAGFHFELTGRENIYFSGAVLGMSRSQITRKFDEIVAFSGVENFLDTPVKYYSSGMYVRLAFAVTAHLESDIFLIDEVLAVGDEEFQKKCMVKMKKIIKEGRTILFVSHNLAAIEDLCKKCILLEAGQIRFMGKTSQCIDLYHQRVANK